jgi:hypothetical protein
MFRRLGGKWAVLAAMSMAIAKKGVSPPPDVNEKFEMARVKIGSDCFSPCDANCVCRSGKPHLLSRSYLG